VAADAGQSARHLKRKCCALAVDLEEESIVAKARKKAPRRKRDWRIVVFLILSLLIALTMILAFLPSILSVPY
jgi:predicted nucleic acid-binding Zn ribbon protein